MTQQNYVNHIALVLDASGSMYRHASQVVDVVDNQIAYLARRSKELDQETRVTVYTFNSHVDCIIYDKDVLRLPSLRNYYRPNGQTALIDATLLSQRDLALTPEKYGDHSFLTYVFTDGEENASRARSTELAKLLSGQPDHWTVAVFVPDINGKHEAKRFGFPADNIAVWDPNSNAGVAEVGETIRRATDTYMAARSTGVRGTRSLFSTAPDAVNAATISASGLKPLNPADFLLVPVPKDAVIKEFVEVEARLQFRLGRCFYQLSKRETIQAQKLVAVVHNKTSQVFLGREARELIGLPDMEVRVSPDRNPDYTIFVQSTSVNRKLVAGTKLLILT